ncbi:MAG: hypothetical protein EVA89_35175 [Sandaracinaceae bacterium]|nr:MAG: hypothetical protein EVA89_35175 [Sandaracinaceae bacterium]
MDLLEDIAGLLVSHERLGIVHRDIKPSNLFVQGSGVFALLDYGIAGSTDSDERPLGALGFQLEGRPVTGASGVLMGTPGYLDPHCVAGNSPDHRSDMYGLGITAWQALAGRHPFLGAGGTVWEALTKALEGVPDIREARPDVHPDLARILQGLTAVNPRERYESARNFLSDIQRHRYRGDAVTGPIAGTVFVAIPFNDGFSRVSRVIEQTGASLGLRAQPMDRVVHLEDIWQQIAREIECASCVVADMSRTGGTDPNANVVTEAAHARAIGKPVILISRDPPETLPFDWRHCPCIRYEQNSPGLARLSEALERRIRHVCAERAVALLAPAGVGSVGAIGWNGRPIQACGAGMNRGAVGV